jgi:hypothetical protein
MLGGFATEEAALERIAQEDTPEDFAVTRTHSHMLLLKDPATGKLSKPILFDMSASKLRISRNWNSQINLRGGDRFAGVWKLHSKATKNSAGQPYMILEIAFEGWAKEEDFAVAEDIYETLA